MVGLPPPFTPTSAHIATHIQKPKDKPNQNPIETKMGKPGSWFGIARNKFFGPSPQNTIIVLHTNNTSFIGQKNPIEDADNEISRKSEVGNGIIPTFGSSSGKNVGEKNQIEDTDNEISRKSEVGNRTIPSIGSSSGEKESVSEEDIAAIKIQAFFRGHLARRAFRALKSLVKLQAVVRGVGARRQSQIAVHCMQVLARLHIKLRSRQLLRS